MLSAAVVPSTASGAGTYDVWSCRAPDGSPAIVRDEGGGWQSVVTGPASGNLLGNSCSDAGALEIVHASEGAHPVGSQSAWRFTAPADLDVSGYSLDISGWARGTRQWGGDTQGLVGVLDSTQPAPNSWTLRREGGVDELSLSRGIVSGTSIGADWLQVIAACDGAGAEYCAPEPGKGIANLKVFRSTITLRDNEVPVVTGRDGDAVNAGIWPRTGVAMSVAATDRGGGVLRVGVQIDDGAPQWHPVADAPCRIWPGTARAFTAPKPCPSAASTTFTIPTAELSPGLHSVRVLVEDAAGNQATAYGPISKRISAAVGPGGDGVGPEPGADPDQGGDPPRDTNEPPRDGGAPLGPPSLAPIIGAVPPVLDPGPPNGTPATGAARLSVRWEGTTSTLRKVRYGQRPVLRGQLTTADGRPVRDATIRIGIRQDHRGSRAEHQTLRTDDGGSFRWRLPKGIGSRRIALSYHEHVGSSAPTATKTLRLEVAAAVRMTLDRRTARQGQTVRLRGSLVGRPLPRVGSVIELQARNPGRKWITFRTIRANRAGRFSAGYRFRMPGPAVFEMRARVRKSGDYPYTTGVSPHRRIVVRR